MKSEPKKGLLKNKTAVIISSIETLAIHLGESISEYGMSVHISDMDFSEVTDIHPKNQSKNKNPKEDFVLIYIRG